MDKMSSSTEQRIMNSLLSVVDATRAGSDPTKAMIKVASDKGYNPQVISRMCEAFNKAKTVHMLQKSSSDTRAESFPIINAQAVITEVFRKPIEKSAKFAALPKNMQNIDFESRTFKRMEKSAAERLAGPNPLEKTAEDTSEYPVNFDLVYGHLKDKEIRENGAMEKLASDIRQEKIRIEKTFNTLAYLLRPLSNKKLNKVAQQVYNKYSHKGDQMLSVLYKKLGKDKPVFEKTAKTVIFPLAEPFVSVTRAMDGYRTYQELISAQKKIEKQAAVGSIIGRLLASARVPTLNEAVQSNLKHDTLDDKGKTILGSELRNRLKKMDAIDTFSDIYTHDDYLSKQPVEETMKAFNTLTKMMPSLMKDESRKELIGPMLRKLVSEGGRVDPLEIPRILEMESNIAKTDKAREEAAVIKDESIKRDQEAFKGETPGMERAIKADIAEQNAPPPGTALKSAFNKIKGLPGDFVKGMEAPSKIKELGMAIAKAKVGGRGLEGDFRMLNKEDIKNLQTAKILDASGAFPATDRVRQEALAQYIAGKPYALKSKKKGNKNTKTAGPGTNNKGGGSGSGSGSGSGAGSQTNNKGGGSATPPSDTDLADLEDEMNNNLK